MRWSNVRTIFVRQVRDQLRDRRTLFMIFVLPLLLYPILGIGMASFASAFGEQKRSVVLIGAKNLPDQPPLLDESRTHFRAEWFEPPTAEEASRLSLRVDPEEPFWRDAKKRAEAVRGGLADAAVVVPEDLKAQLKGDEPIRVPLAFNSADDKSLAASVRVRDVLDRWREAIVSGRLKRDNKPASYVEPVRVDRQDVAGKEEAGGNVWARDLPRSCFVMMAMTGARSIRPSTCARVRRNAARWRRS